MSAPRPFGAVPSPRQLAWHELEFYGFLHFSINTFTDAEWGFGDEDPRRFAPTEFDADQIAETARDGGMRGLILTCKHHDGFCLWPTRTTAHSVRASGWRDGRGDVVRELSEACARAGLKFGIYVSPWDRNHAGYGGPSYVEVFREQLRELLDGYGPLFEVWFDGANGGDGFYGGARERREIDPRSYYDWPRTWELVRELQPQACIFSDAGPDVRWVGNEEGRAEDPCWATADLAGEMPGTTDPARLARGERGGASWAPAECDVSIRPGWFHHPSEDGRVKGTAELLEIYFASVGRGAALLLNLPPDRRGRIPAPDRAALLEHRRRLARWLGEDLARSARVFASGAHGAAAEFAAGNVADGRRDTFWCAGERGGPAWLELELAAPAAIGGIGLREHLPLGQRVEGFEIDAWSPTGWSPLVRGTSVGSRRLLRPERRVETTRLRLRFAPAPAPPALSEVSVHAAEP